MRYFFHFSDCEGRSKDAEGLNLSSEGDARREAILAAAETLRDQVRKGADFDHFGLQVTDEAGRTVMKLNLTIKDARAT